MNDQIDIEELIDANIKNNLEGDEMIVPFNTNIPPKWSVSLDDSGYKQLPNGVEFVHDDVRNIKLFEDVGTVDLLHCLLINLLGLVWELCKSLIIIEL